MRCDDGQFIGTIGGRPIAGPTAAFAFVDQFLIRRQGNQLFLLAGEVGLPLMTGSLEEQVEFAVSITELPVFVCGEFVMERDAAEEFVKVLNKMLAT